jgi:hypothetical protein
VDKTTFSAPVNTCTSCRFVDRKNPGNGTLVAICRKNPPTVASTFIQNGPNTGCMQQTIWPVLDAVSDWCGSWEGRTN